MWGDKHIYPYYNDDNDYNTNAPSFYDYLAKNRHLLKELVNKIWEYDKELAIRFEEWDKNIAELPENLEALLVEWMQDDTLATIINDTIFSWKVDLTEFREFQNASNDFQKYVQTRFENLNAADFNKNLKKFDSTYFTDEFNQELANNTITVNPVIEDGQITRNKIADGAVNINKLDINGYLPKGFKVELGYDPSRVSSAETFSRAFIDTGVLFSGNKIKSLNNEFQVSVFEKVETGIYEGKTNWAYETTLTRNFYNSAIVFKKTDGSLITRDDLMTFYQWFEITDEKTAVQFKDIENLYDYKAIGRNENIIFNGLITGGIEDIRNYTDNYIKGFAFEGVTVRDNQYIIQPGGYLFIRFNQSAFVDEESVYFNLKMVSGFTSSRHSVRISPNTPEFYYFTSGIDEITVPIPDDIYYKSDFEIRFDNRTSSETVVIDHILANFNGEISPINLAFDYYQGGSTDNETKYVSLNGSDLNNGNTLGSGFKTLQKAIESIGGKGTIIVERGVYNHQSVNYQIKDLTILAADDTYSTNKPNRQLVEFKGSDVLSNWASFEGVYRTNYTGNTRFDSVFIDKSLPIQTDNSRPSYNAVLWEGNNNVDDYKMKPVLTLDECKNEVGTFFYDGTYVYINPQDIANEFNAVKTGNGLTLYGDSLTMQDITFDFYTGNVLNLDKVKNLNVQNCEASHSSTSDGWSLDYTNGVLTNCMAFKNRNDGFNLHFYGNTKLVNCKGNNNYDDGVSHHEQCKGVIIGGEYSGNGKGGVIPVDDAEVQVYNAVIENNHYGFYNESDKAVSQGNFYKGNRIAITNKAATPIKSISDTFVDNVDTDLVINNVIAYGENIL